MVIIVSVCGKGQRFKDENFCVDKPMLKPNGVSLFKRAIKQFKKKDVITVQLKDRKLDLDVKTKTVYVPKTETKGPIDSILYALEKVPDNENIIIVDCDIEIDDNDILDKIKNSLESSDGTLLTFESDEPKYSYVKLSKGIARQVKEKKVISKNAILGAYCFKNKKILVENIKDTIDRLREQNQEWYMSEIFQTMIKNNYVIKTVQVNNFRIWGTPKEFEDNLLKELL